LENTLPPWEKKYEKGKRQSRKLLKKTDESGKKKEVRGKKMRKGEVNG
jgi:hypothetical protein